MKRILAILCIVLLLQSCGGTAHLLQKEYDGKTSYEINKYYGCCGCYAFYYNIYENKKLQSQFVAEMNCNFWSPTRFSFLHGTEAYVCVTDSSYEIPLTALEKKLFLKLDSLAEGMNEIKYSTFTGFRKPKEGEKVRSSALK